VGRFFNNDALLMHSLVSIFKRIIWIPTFGGMTSGNSIQDYRE